MTTITWPKELRYVRPPDVYGYDEIARFDRAFVECLIDGKYPGPTPINERRSTWTGRPIGGKNPNRINGRLTHRRRQLMYLFGIEYKNPMTYEDFPGITTFQTPIRRQGNSLGLRDEHFGMLMLVNGEIVERKRLEPRPGE